MSKDFSGSYRNVLKNLTDWVYRMVIEFCKLYPTTESEEEQKAKYKTKKTKEIHRTSRSGSL